MKPLISKAARIIGIGDQLSGANQKLKEAVHSFLIWFCPLVQNEKLPFEDWRISHYGNDAWGLDFTYNDKSCRIRSDGFECEINDYHRFCLLLAKSEKELTKWMQQLVIERRALAHRLEQLPGLVNYQPAKAKSPITVGRTDCYLIVLRSHPDFPDVLAPEVEGTWAGTNPAWPEASVEFLLQNQLDPPCHVDWDEFSQERTEERENLTAFVVWVRPGPKPKPVNVSEALTDDVESLIERRSLS